MLGGLSVAAAGRWSLPSAAFQAGSAASHGSVGPSPLALWNTEARAPGRSLSFRSKEGQTRLVPAVNYPVLAEL